MRTRITPNTDTFLRSEYFTFEYFSILLLKVDYGPPSEEKVILCIYSLIFPDQVNKDCVSDSNFIKFFIYASIFNGSKYSSSKRIESCSSVVSAKVHWVLKGVFRTLSISIIKILWKYLRTLDLWQSFKYASVFNLWVR